MIKVIENEGNLIYYECDCGVKGRCMVKPLKDEGTIVVNLKCAMCGELSRVVLLQYKADGHKSDLLDHTGENELSWSLVLSNEIIE